MAKPNKKPKNYIENKELYEQIKRWKLKYDAEKELTGIEIGVSEELTRSILLIATRTATRYNFSNYSFNEDMIQDAMYVILKYMRNYDLTRTNPHAYITTCCMNAFVNRINIEKKATIKKYKHYVDFVETNADIITNESAMAIDYDIVDQMYTRIDEFESKGDIEADEDLDNISDDNLIKFFDEGEK